MTPVRGIRGGDSAIPSALALCLALLVGHPAPGRALPLADPSAPGSRPVPLPLQEEAGLQRLIASGARADYGPLAQTFLTQNTLASCGLASATMVLNSLPLPAPRAAELGAYHFWTQENLLVAAGPASGLTAALVNQRGMTLAELDRLLVLLGATVQRRHGDQLSLSALRRLLQRSLADPADRLIVNFERSAVGQGQGGHLSPLAAFHAPSDSVLMLDVARYRFPAAWIPVTALWRAMRSTDSQSGRARGLLIVRAAPVTPLQAGADQGSASAHVDGTEAIPECGGRRRTVGGDDNGCGQRGGTGQRRPSGLAERATLGPDLQSPGEAAAAIGRTNSLAVAGTDQGIALQLGAQLVEQPEVTRGVVFTEDGRIPGH